MDWGSIYRSSASTIPFMYCSMLFNSSTECWPVPRTRNQKSTTRVGRSTIIFYIIITFSNDDSTFVNTPNILFTSFILLFVIEISDTELNVLSFTDFLTKHLCKTHNRYKKKRKKEFVKVFTKSKNTDPLFRVLRIVGSLGVQWRHGYSAFKRVVHRFSMW